MCICISDVITKLKNFPHLNIVSELHITEETVKKKTKWVYSSEKHLFVRMWHNLVAAGQHGKKKKKRESSCRSGAATARVALLLRPLPLPLLSLHLHGVHFTRDAPLLNSSPTRRSTTSYTITAPPAGPLTLTGGVHFSSLAERIQSLLEHPCSNRHSVVVWIHVQ